MISLEELDTDPIQTTKYTRFFFFYNGKKTQNIQSLILLFDLTIDFNNKEKKTKESKKQDPVIAFYKEHKTHPRLFL